MNGHAKHNSRPGAKHSEKQQQQAQQRQQQQQSQQQQMQANQAAQGLKSLGLQLHQGSSLVTYVYIKRQKAQGGVDAERTTAAAAAHALYVTGLPLGLDEASLQAIFQLFGEVVDVVMHPSKRSAAVVYESAEGVSAAMKQGSSGQLVQYDLPVQDSSSPVGLKAWVAQHKAARPGNDALQKQLDAWVDAHEAQEATRLAAQQAAMAEDGWTVVTRTKGRKRAREEGGMSTVSGGMPQAAAAVAAAAAAGVQQSRLTENFYRFQQREQRRTELLEIRQQFEEGRKRLAALKAARHFKPS